MEKIVDTKKCKNCSITFTITDDDLKFYEKVSPKIDGKTYKIPPPTLCPDCRQQRRFVFRNERTLYRRKCDLCNKDMVSVYTPNTAFPAYCADCWWSDKWDPMDYGQEYDFSRSFFEQLKEMRDKIPRLGLYRDQASENSEYMNHGNDNKNCYLAFLCVESEDLYFCDHCYKAKDCVDCFRVDGSEICYECNSCQGCWNLLFSQNCNGCRDSLFLINCRNCENCIGCVNLRNKSYHIFNEKVTKEEFKDFKKKFKSYKFVAGFKDKFLDFAKNNVIYNENHNVNCEDLVDCDYCQNSKNCYGSFDLFDCQDVKYTSAGGFMTDSYDMYSSGFGNLLYESIGVGSPKIHGANIYFSFYVLAPYNVFYSDVVHTCDNLFGCIGLRHKKYCILNKQYSKEEYEKLVPKIIEHMRETGDWGEFFPMTLSPYYYNDTVAHQYYPLTKEQALAKGLKWKDPDPKEYKNQEYEIADGIDEVPDEIVGKILSCSDCGKNYKIIQQELKFYKRVGVPIPRLCLDCRYSKRFKLRNPKKIWSRKCDKCGKEIRTSFSPDRPEKVYCEECYLKEVV